MKRFFAIAIIALTAAGSIHSQTLEDFQTAFTDFTGKMAGSLAANSTIGSNWSDAYIGKFPHFGAGVTVGAAFISADGVTPLINAMGASALPPALKSLGVPIPAAVVTLKLGIPFLPLDIGIKGGYIPQSLGNSLQSSTGASVNYANVGIQLRYAILRQNLLLPNISVGASYNYMQGSITAPTAIGAKNFTVATDQGLTTITASDPALALGWTSHTFDFTTQVSKQFLFLVPYLGAGYTFGTSSVTGGVTSTMSAPGYNSPTYGSGISGLNSFFASNGGPTINDQGFTYTATSTTPVLRVYGGLSFRIILVDIDTQVMYVPVTKGLGFSATARVQL